MKRFFGVIGILVLCGVVLLLGTGLGKTPEKPILPAFVPGEVLVQFWAGVTPEQINQVLRKVDADIKEKIEPQRIYVVTFPHSISPKDMAARLRHFPEVARAEPNAVVQPFLGDTLFSSEALGAEMGSVLGAGAKVIVAVIDTAIDATHPALAGKVVPGYNALDGSGNTQSIGVGQDWHGTASAGRILDGAGDANIQIMPVQVFGTSGGAPWSDIIKAINYAVDHGAQVINMSLGGYSNSPFVQQAIDRAVDKGIVVVASAGNDNTDRPAYPASMNGVISVAAANEEGKKASFSNYGPTVDITAPGDTSRLLSHGGYRMAAGTSFSAPFIAGMVAMLKSAFPFLTARQMEETLKAKANPVPDSERKLMGAGFLNALSVKKWMEEIRSGTFIFPWSRQPIPLPASSVPVQPWLVRGHGHSGEYRLTPAGDVVKDEK